MKLGEPGLPYLAPDWIICSFANSLGRACRVLPTAPTINLCALNSDLQMRRGAAQIDQCSVSLVVLLKGTSESPKHTGF